MTLHTLIGQISRELQGASGVAGVVLGGSRARGTHHETSDVDIGIYYDESAGFDLERIGKIAAKWDDGHREDLIFAPGQWGPWVNGGGWLVVQGYRVDLIFRDIRRVAAVIDECLQGIVSSHSQAGHPHAYLNVMYMGEIAVCQILSDPAGRIAALKAKTSPYPKAVRSAIIGQFRFEASFSLQLAENTVDKDDISYVAGHIFRSISAMNQVLFALNETYCINEKKAVNMIEGFRVKPRHYKQRIDTLYALLGTDQERSRTAVEMLRALVAETEELLERMNR